MSSSGNLKMTVNVSLCGSIPRSQMNFSSTRRLPEFNSRRNTVINSMKPCQLSSASSSSEPSSVSSLATKPSAGLPRRVSNDNISLSEPAPKIDPPSWAVAASGDSILEPVCESLNLQSSVDLTSQAVFRIGRSQNSDVQLLHYTSSRRHALLFHHPNGSCYVVDCGSAHGTYVNGVRVKTEMQTQNSDGSSKPSGIILPHRVKKGALIRFGGPGAPSFILKSFSVGLDSLLKTVEEEKKKKRKLASMLDCPSSFSSGSPSTADAMLAVNTRLNALGSAAKSLSSKSVSPSLTSARLHAQLFPLQSSGISFLKKRSIVSFDEENDIERELQCCKKIKMSTTCDEQEQPFTVRGTDIAIVSPIRQKTTLVLDLSKIERPVVSPTPLELTERPPFKENNVLKGILTTTSLALPSTRKTKRRVMFSEAEPDVH